MVVYLPVYQPLCEIQIIDLPSRCRFSILTYYQWADHGASHFQTLCFPLSSQQLCEIGMSPSDKWVNWGSSNEQNEVCNLHIDVQRGIPSFQNYCCLGNYTIFLKWSLLYSFCYYKSNAYSWQKSLNIERRKRGKGKKDEKWPL